MNYTKDFSNWFVLKQSIQDNLKKDVRFKERDVWWTSIGHNIGSEEDGKGKYYLRPVLIVKKFNNQLFWGLPLSTTKKRGVYYYEVELGGKIGAVLLSQLKTLDYRRLISKYGMLSSEDFNQITNRIKNLL